MNSFREFTEQLEQFIVEIEFFCEREFELDYEGLNQNMIELFLIELQAKYKKQFGIAYFFFEEDCTVVVFKSKKQHLAKRKAREVKETDFKMETARNIDEDAYKYKDILYKFRTFVVCVEVLKYAEWHRSERGGLSLGNACSIGFNETYIVDKIKNAYYDSICFKNKVIEDVLNDLCEANILSKRKYRFGHGNPTVYEILDFEKLKELANG